MSSYPNGADTPDAPWNQYDEESVSASCAICNRQCISDDEACTWRDASSERFIDAGKAPNGRFVCSTACSSQAMYEAATAEERAALNLLAKWNESTLTLRKAFLSFNPYQREIDVKHQSVWEQWNSSYDILKLYKLMEKIGYELTGDDEAPAWYSDAVSHESVAGSEELKPQRKPVQSVTADAKPATKVSDR